MLYLKIALVGVVGITAGLVVPSSSAQADSGRYVALGDSYSAGVGSGSYSSSSGACSRSTRAYPQLWVNQHPGVAFSFVACSGATTTDVIKTQLGALTASTTLVSISVGGNDENFSSVMKTCVLSSTTTCVSAVNAQIADANAHLGAKLDELYAKIRNAAPHAHVVTLDYPDFYDLSTDPIGLSQQDRTQIDKGVDTIDAVIAHSAAKAGFTFADVRSRFKGHELGDSSPWLNSMNLLSLNSSYHPTADGQVNAYYPTFSTSAG